MQDIQICDAKGRDCIEKNSAETFNCSTTCSGIYADVQWVGSDIEEEIREETDEVGELNNRAVDDMMQSFHILKMELEREIKLMRKDIGEIVKSTLGKGVDEQDKKIYKRLITDYRKFKTRNVKYYSFNKAAHLSSYGRG